MNLIVAILFPFAQSVLNWVTILFPDSSKDGIKKTGLKIIAFFGVYGNLAGLMILGGVHPMHRFVVLLLTPLGAWGIVAMMKLNDDDVAIKNKSRTAVKWFWWINVTIPFAGAIIFAVLGVFDVTPVIAGEWIKELFRYIHKTPMIQSVIFGSIVAVLGHLILKKVEWTKMKKDGADYEGRLPSWMARSILIALFLVAVIYPWIDPPHNKYKVPEPPVAGSETELQKAKAENDRLKAEVLKKSKGSSAADAEAAHARPVRTSHTERPSKEVDPCLSSVSYAAKHNLGCPCCLN